MTAIATHPARERMLAAGRMLPGVWDAIARAREAEPDPAGVSYVTETAAAHGVLSAMAANAGMGAIEQLRNAGSLAVTRFVQPFATLAAWRMTQGIYRIDPTLYADLIATPITGDLPASALARLPEWCIYVETPGLPVPGVDGTVYSARGAWCRVYREADGLDVLDVLVISMDLEAADSIESQHIPLRGTLEQSMADLLADWAGEPILEDRTQEALSGAMAYAAPVLSLLLYIVGTTDITGPDGARPGNPAPVKTRRHGLRLFPADAPRAWDVGVRMGAALRQAYAARDAADGAGAGGTVRPHIRRAHWHAFRTGPRLDAQGTPIAAHLRPADVRWLPPIPVNLPDPDTMPATIRRV